jgi:hypothetical protein
VVISADPWSIRGGPPTGLDPLMQVTVPTDEGFVRPIAPMLMPVGAAILFGASARRPEMTVDGGANVRRAGDNSPGGGSVRRPWRQAGAGDDSSHFTAWWV